MSVHAHDPWLRAALWRTIGRHAFRLSPYNAFKYRRGLLRMFGAQIAPGAKIRRRCDLDRPWHLAVGARSMIGDDVIIRADAPVTIGNRCTVSQMAMIITDAPDVTEPTRPPRSAPITLEDDSWLATDALALPGTTLREGVVVGARSVADGDYEPWTIAVGTPARSIRVRVIEKPEEAAA